MKHIHLCILTIGISACSVAPRNETAPAMASGAVNETVPANDDPSFEPAKQNPFLGAQFTLNSDYAKQVEAAAGRHPAEASRIRAVASQPTAVWLHNIESTRVVTPTLQAAALQSQGGRPMLTVFVVYDLPNRDCSAKSSSGELSADAAGIERYRKEFIDPIAAQFAQFPDQRIVVVLEPDSLPNLATNMSVPKCAQAEMAYRSSIAYAVSKFAMPNVSTYLDAAHAGWLGWNGNRTKIAHIFQEVLTQAGGADKIRGFATNVSNYNTLSQAEGKKLGPSNPCPDELTYISKLSEELRRVGINNKQFIIDTARNGRAVRKTWGNWCNIQGAGLGMRPAAGPAPQIDAYFWIKPPGESDGVADPTQPRFDVSCQSADSSPNAPQAGQWFEAYFLELVKNAEPPI
jgi:cellulose 1,4-beta-cellobiosidase